MWNCFF
ncbi:Protein CBG27028 [Caenorhabditis briggsae]|nr:Protein CBG27028 [Caenorhabditis briggsae]CAS01023.1 Protein CBG27028 [Caenorhabditis briggsae]